MKAERQTDNAIQSEGKGSSITVRKRYTLYDFITEKKTEEILNWLNLIRNYNKEKEEVKE